MSVNIDIAQILQEVRISLQVVNNAMVERKRQREHARLIVYQALSIHPALDNLQLPSPFDSSFRKLFAIYSPSPRSKSWLKRLFSGQRDKHFKRLAPLGTIGTRATIMLILLWIIGNQLEDGAVENLISKVCESGIQLRATTRPQNVVGQEATDLATEIAKLRSVFVSLRKTIKKKLPLKQGYNPFQGIDFDATDEMPRPLNGLSWPHTLPEHQIIPYNICDDPDLLLHRVASGSVLIPESKLTELVVNWATTYYRLGKDVSREEDFDEKAYWNAHCRCDHNGSVWAE
ncbi:hypothetical protein GYMLUDRAFT_86274 [Collybiopsis luxurians FD-317 M1]|uniref:Uncharacterized protein n=1 Tax=Collybiopsis luxurians FD-317 M1 TaxID=944289 RepID=A0A0D0CRU6_9AGAR|nr:hypothetical protein GYMLUDRAFT_86274 [Collybiopsis luxurians FD-317 M1]